MKRSVAVFSAFLAHLVIAAPANAAVVINITEQGSNVVASGSGSLDTTGLAPSFIGNSSPMIFAENGFIYLGDFDGSLAYKTFTGISGPSSFGPGDNTLNFATSNNDGSQFGVRGSDHRLYVPFEYISGTALSSTQTWDNQSFASLGLNVGSYVYTWGTGEHADSLTVNIAAAVPEPSTWAMMILGFAGVGFMTYRRRKTAALAA